MSKKHNKNRGTTAPAVNPQGYAQDGESTNDPKTQLEDRAKRSNTKI